MSTETSPERRRPRRQIRGWVTLFVVLVPLAIVVAIRSTSLNGLPDIGDPFDIEEFARPIPEETNAFVFYRQAFEKRVKRPPDQNPPVWNPVWSATTDDQRRLLDQSRASLELWKHGTARPDALYIATKSMNIGTLLPVIQELRDLARLAILEGSRLEAAGDLSGALDWYVAVLRSSRHCGKRGLVIERLVGSAIGASAATRLSSWAVAPKVDAALLRRALDAVLEASSMTPPSSDTFKAEYVMFMNTLDDPKFDDPTLLLGGGVPWGWTTGPGRAYFRAERAIKREPERSRRVFRLITANWLAYCDRPPADRPPMANLPASPPSTIGTGMTPLSLFTPDRSAPDPVRAIPPEKLASWYDSTLYARMLEPSTGGIAKAIRRDRSTFANLQMTLANELHMHEKGHYPAKVEDLVGPYLQAIPEGYVPKEGDNPGPPKGQ